MQSQTPRLLCSYGYDALDRLISHALPQTPEGQRFYCKSRLATEIQGAVKYSVVQNADQILAQQRIEHPLISMTLLATDQQHSVLNTLKADSLQQHIAYSPYGHRLAENGLLSLLGFNGEPSDPITGHYPLGNGYRAYNACLMRFNSPDSLSPFGKGGLNSYAYCLGDPVNSRDPNGHFSFKNVVQRIILTRRLNTLNQTHRIKLWKAARLKSEKALIAGDNFSLQSLAANKTDENIYSLMYKRLASKKVLISPTERQHHNKRLALLDELAVRDKDGVLLGVKPLSQEILTRHRGHFSSNKDIFAISGAEHPGSMAVKQELTRIINQGGSAFDDFEPLVSTASGIRH